MAVELGGSIYQSSVTVPESFSNSKIKRQLYSVDTYYRESYEDLRAMWGEEMPKLQRLAAVVFKPEAVVGRRIHAGLDYFIRQSFLPLVARCFTYNRFIIREAWRYQFNVATRDRIRIVDILEPSTESIYVLFIDSSGDCTHSASERLSSLKGPSIPELRVPGQLRYELGVRSVLLNYVHTPDDTADLVREMGIYFREDERKDILRAIDETEAVPSKLIQTDIARTTNNVYARYPPHDLSFLSSLARVEHACHVKLRTAAPDVVLRCLEMLKKIATMESRDWRKLFDLLKTADVLVDPWDLIVIGTEVTESNLPGVAPLI